MYDKHYKLVLLRPRTLNKGPEGFIEGNNGIIAYFRFLMTEDGFIHTPIVETITKKKLNQDYFDMIDLLFEFIEETNKNL